MIEDKEETPSKSALKREMTALQKLGEALVDLTEPQLSKLALPDLLLEAVLQAQSISARGGRKRQLQYIGKLMRKVEDPEAIATALQQINDGSNAEKARFRRIENWRDRFLENGDQTLDEFVREHPEADRGQIRQLVRNAHKEKTADKPPKSARALFQLLRDTIE